MLLFDGKATVLQCGDVLEFHTVTHLSCSIIRGGVALKHGIAGEICYFLPVSDGRQAKALATLLADAVGLTVEDIPFSAEESLMIRFRLVD